MHSCTISRRPASWRLVKFGSVFPMREKRINSRGKAFTVRVWFGRLKPCLSLRLEEQQRQNRLSVI